MWQPQPEQKPYDPITAADNMTYGVPDFPDYPLKVYIDLHTALDILGMIPVYGEVFDFGNGIYYLIEGDFLNAFLSLAAFFPVADIPAKIGRGIVNVARRYGQEAADALLWLIKQGGDYVDEGVGVVDDKIDEIVDEIGKIDINVKPDVTNEKLKNIVNDLYKGQGGPNTIGNGTTMDAVRNEIRTGLPTNGKFHTQKLKDYQNALRRRLRAGDLNEYDTAVVNALLEDIANALAGN